jgi:hypothetical protein
MSSIFDRVAHGYFTPFGGLTTEAAQCRTFTLEKLPALLHVRQREKFVKEVQVCCCGYGSADEDEPMLDSHFSQFQFFRPWIEEIIFFHDKFDYLVKCVAHGVCKIEEGFAERYVTALLDVLTFRDTTIPHAPEHVLDLRQPTTPRICAEVKRSFEERMRDVARFINKHGDDYTGAQALRLELEALERDQTEAETKRSLPLPTLQREKEDRPTVKEREKGDSPQRTGGTLQHHPPDLMSSQADSTEEAARIAKYRTGGLDALLSEGAQRTPLLLMIHQIQREEEARKIAQDSSSPA